MATLPAGAAARREPWMLRWAELRPGILLASGAVLAVAGLAAVEWAGEPRLKASRFFLVMLAAYGVAAPLAIRGALRSLDALAGVVPNAPRRAWRPELARLPLPWWLPAVLMGVTAHLVILTGADGAFGSAAGDRLATIAGWVHVLAFAAVSALLVRQGWIFLNLGRALGRIDLLDATPLAPFVDTALRLALIYALLVGGAVAFHVDMRYAPPVLLLTPFAIVILVLLFLFPLWGVHRRLVAERDAELRRVHAAIRGDRLALRDSIVSEGAASLDTVALLQYRAQVQSLPVWPFDGVALLRLGLYVGIPVVGWIGGALVERVLDLALD